MSKLKGRVLNREHHALMRAFDVSKQPLIDKAKSDIAQAVFDVFKIWAADKASPADIEVLKRYGHASEIKGVNVRYYCDAEKLWNKTLGFQFPEGCSVVMPSQGLGGSYLAVYTGGPHVSKDNIPEMLPLVRGVLELQHALEADREAFRAFLTTKPLRQRLAETNPDIAQFISL